MDWLNRARQFVGNLFGGAQRTIGQISGGVARAVGQAEQQAARTAQQVVKQIPQPPRIQLPQIPQIQMPRFQAPQAPRIDFGAVARALQGFQQGLDISGRTFTGKALTPEQQRLVAQIPGGKTMLAATPRASEIGQFLRSTAPGIDLGLSIKEKGLGAFSAQERMQRGLIPAIQQQTTRSLQRLMSTPEGQQLQRMPGLQGQIGQAAQMAAFNPEQAIKSTLQTGVNIVGEIPGIKQISQTKAGKIANEYLINPTVNSLITNLSRIGGAQTGQKTYAKGLQGEMQNLSDIINIGSLIYSGNLSTQLASKTTPFFQTAAKLAPRLFASGTGQDLITQLAEGKKPNELDWKRALMAGGAYTTFGIGIPGVTRGGSTAFSKLFGTSAATKIAQTLPKDKNAPITVGSLPEKGALRAQGYTNVKVDYKPKPGQVAPTLPVKPIYENVPKSYLQPQGKVLQTAGKLNVDRLNLSNEQKLRIANNQNINTDILTNEDVINIAKDAGIDTKTYNIDQTRQIIAKQLNIRSEIVSLENQAANLSKTGGNQIEIANIYKKVDELARTSSEQGTNIARQLQARRIIADETKTPMQKVFLLLNKAGINPDVYTKKAVGVDFNNPNEVIKFYRELVPAKASDWLDLVRYNSMLTSPTTQIVNLSSTLGNIAVAPLERTIASNLDFVRSLVSGKPRQYAGGEGRAYAKGILKSIPDGVNAFKRTLKGLDENINLDVGSQGGNIPIAGVGQKKTFDVLEFPMRLMGAFDNFNRALVYGGSMKALERRAAKGINVINPEAISLGESAYRTFNQKIGEESQGAVLKGIDEITNAIMKVRNSKNKFVSVPAKWTLPFVRIGANLSKQGLEYSPFGVVTTIGAKNKTDQLAKAMIGTAVYGTIAGLFGADKLTWAEPTNENERNAFRAAGKQPYSFKVGNTWINYAKLPPYLSFSFAFVASVQDAIDKGKVDSNILDNVLTGVSNYGNFLADQTYLKNVGDLLATIKGDPTAINRLLGNYPQQLVPFRAFSGWIARMTDPIQRQVNKDANFAQKQVELLMQQIPGLRQMTTPKTDLQGNPIPSQLPILNAFSPTNISQERQPQAEQYNLMMQLKKEESQNKQSMDIIKKAYLKGDTSVLQGLDDKTKKSLEKSLKTDEAKKTLNPLELSLFNLSNEELKAKKSDPKLTAAVNKVIELKKSLAKPVANTPAEKYQAAVDKYNQDMKDGTISKIENITRQKELANLRVASGFSQDAVDLYQLNGKQIKQYLDTTPGSKTLWEEVLKLDQAYKDAGVITKYKFRDKYGNIYLPGTAPKGAKGARVRISSLKAPRLKAIKVAVPKAPKVSFKQPTPTKARKSIKIKTG